MSSRYWCAAEAVAGRRCRRSARGQRTTGVTPRRYPRRRASWCSACCSPPTGRRRRAGAVDHRGRARPGTGRGGGARGTRSGRADDVVQPGERRGRGLGPLPRHLGRALRGDGGPCRAGLALLVPEPEGAVQAHPRAAPAVVRGQRADHRAARSGGELAGGPRCGARGAKPVRTHRLARRGTGRRPRSRRVRRRRTEGRRSAPTSGRRGSGPAWTSWIAGWPTRSGGAWPLRTPPRAGVGGRGVPPGRRAGRGAGQPRPPGDRAVGCRAERARRGPRRAVHAPHAGGRGPPSGRARSGPGHERAHRRRLDRRSGGGPGRHARHRPLARRRPERHRGASHHRAAHLAPGPAHRSMGAAARLRRLRPDPLRRAGGRLGPPRRPAPLPRAGADPGPRRRGARAGARRRRRSLAVDGGRHPGRCRLGHRARSRGSSAGPESCGPSPRPGQAGSGWALVDGTGAVPLVVDRAIATLLAVSGGRPVVVAGEHRATGFAPLAVRAHDRTAALR